MPDGRACDVRDQDTPLPSRFLRPRASRGQPRPPLAHLDRNRLLTHLQCPQTPAPWEPVPVAVLCAPARFVESNPTESAPFHEAMLAELQASTTKQPKSRDLLVDPRPEMQATLRRG